MRKKPRKPDPGVKPAGADRLRRFFEDSPDVHYSYDLRTRTFRFVSPSVKTLLGYPRRAYEEDPNLVCRTVHKEDCGKVQDLVNGTLPGSQMILRWHHPDGGIIWTEHRHLVSRDEHGQPACVSGTAREVTGREAEAQRLRHLDDQFRGLTDLARHGIWMLDEHHRILYANQPLADLLGYQVEHFLDRSVGEFLDESVPADRLAKTLLRGQLSDEPVDVRLRRRDGTHVWVLLSAHPLQDGAGRPAGMVAILSDLDDLRVLHGRVTLDLANLRVLEDGREVALTTTEFLLLRCLMQNRGRPVSRDDLLREVAAEGTDANLRMADVHISHLRKKLPSIAGLVVATSSGYQLIDPDEPGQP